MNEGPYKLLFLFILIISLTGCNSYNNSAEVKKTNQQDIPNTIEENHAENDFIQNSSPSDYIIKENNGYFTIEIPGKDLSWDWFDLNNFFVSYSEEDNNRVILRGRIDGTKLHIRILDKLSKLNYTYMFDIGLPLDHGYIYNGILLRYLKGQWLEYRGLYLGFPPTHNEVVIKNILKH